jgi:hypothetical protein
MIFAIRPSKCYLYERLEKHLSRLNGTIGVDAGSAFFKHRRFFKTRFYYGIDLNPGLVKEGLAKYPEQTVFGIHADLAALDPLPTGSADAVVSTNTLYCLPLDRLPLAIGHLARITAPRGGLFIELPKASAEITASVLKPIFRDVHVTYFQNFVSKAYEKLFEKNGFLGSHPIAGSKPFLVLSWLISRLEYATRRIAWMNHQALIICAEKRDQTANAFDLAGVPQAGARLFTLLS